MATDVASRGLDVKGIALVVNMDLPRSFEDYVHRIGRTGRAGVQGRSTSFYTDRDSFIVAQVCLIHYRISLLTLGECITSTCVQQSTAYAKLL